MLFFFSYVVGARLRKSLFGAKKNPMERLVVLWCIPYKTRCGGPLDARKLSTYHCLYLLYIVQFFAVIIFILLSICMIVKVKLELSVSYYYSVSMILILYYLGKQHLFYSLLNLLWLAKYYCSSLVMQWVLGCISLYSGLKKSNGAACGIVVYTL